MKKKYISFLFLILLPSHCFGEASISPILFFKKNTPPLNPAKQSGISANHTASVTVRFKTLPDETRLLELENQGITFKRRNGKICHIKDIYLANVELDSLESLSRSDDILRIESTHRPSVSPTLNVSNPQVQASEVWAIPHNPAPIDGSGVIVANVDTGIDIFHPGFFKPDGGIYDWIDVNESGSFEGGSDAVDINGNGTADPDELLNFFDASFSDYLDIMEREDGVYEADIDWLYNDSNNNSVRDFGPDADADYTEDDPSFGELLFIISDTNGNNSLDPGEQLTALGTTRIIATYDKQGTHTREDADLFDALGDVTNHGTGASGIVGGQVPGRRLVGMAPGVEFLSVNRMGLSSDPKIHPSIEDGMMWAQEMGADIMMYEFGSYVWEFLDGTSNLEVLINNLYDQGIHQFTASGNLAGPARKKHSFITVEKSNQDTLLFTIPKIGIKYVYLSVLWTGKQFDISLKLVSGSDSLSITGDNKSYNFNDYSVFSGKDFSEKSIYMMVIRIYASDTFLSQTDMSIIIENKSSSVIDCDAYIADDVSAWMYGAQFQNFITDDGTVCSPGTAEKGITVGAYDPRGKRNEEGELNDFSSWGKTTDGRRAVDITAPGSVVYSLISHDAVGGQPGGYIDFGGTSSALPHVVGCAALILQVSPNITPDELAQVLFSGALFDAFTGPVPNNKWGYGKLRVYDSLINSSLITNVDETDKPLAFSVSPCYPNPFNSSAHFDIVRANGNNSAVHLDVYNLLGQKVRTINYNDSQALTQTIVWDGRMDSGIEAATGVYFFRFVIDNHSFLRKALFLK